MTKLMINKEVEEFIVIGEKTLIEFMAYCQEMINKHGPTCKFEWVSGYDDTYLSIMVPREETDQEYKARLEKEKSIKEHEERRERALYERLKTKFE